ncbi:hypothetical protein [Roseibaca sp. Y0-43]|uniref:hypothetical protein n=1 Tax=Roseibaca sp. Y0-43 TaxID=2816854 RepID=UPI001D0C01CF|nr:hypothetical protein [Roseibaca sp. Y0-43]MCC1482410.1 hypothetical protein [Roseibaca sp. Y0-43]
MTQYPYFWVSGKQGAVHDVVRSVISMSDVVVANASYAELSIDGGAAKKVSAEELRAILAKVRQAEVRLKLVNASERHAAPVLSHYSISFRVAGLEALKAVEEAFTEILVSSSISREAISRFLADPRTCDAGKEYASGLADYCLGILLKERPEGERLTTPLSRYRELYGSALQVLKDIQRPLAHLIEKIIRFSMNDFSDDQKRTGYWELDLATQLLLDPSSIAPQIEFEEKERRAVCPIDHGTGRMLELAANLSAQPRWSPILQDECRVLANSDLLDVSDHQKAFAIWAASAWRLSSRDSALEPLRHIAGIYPFSQWAGKYLEQVST